ncbi:flavodoxin [Congregibacter variabilis]|uniref:Flavodoxin n=1 Tax=Congregibacter variabilis TaxID=3081200 RepID=A0ABZ0I6D5_9GAMM|nr:flavodoxin [Congregibacter sp. IMCC43200]
MGGKTEFAVLIVYHSQSGASAQLAAASWRGATEHNSAARIERAADVGATDIKQSSGVLFVCAENSGRLSGGMKDLLDRIFYPLISAGCSLPYALLVTAGNDGRGAVAEAQRILSGIPFTEALEPRIIRGPVDPEALKCAEELGAGFAVGLEMGIF